MRGYSQTEAWVLKLKRTTKCLFAYEKSKNCFNYYTRSNFWCKINQIVSGHSNTSLGTFFNPKFYFQDMKFNAYRENEILKF